MRYGALGAWLALALTACTGGTRTVYVDLHTDHTPGVDFVAVRVEVSDTSFARPGAVLTAPLHEVDPALDYGTGARVAEIDTGHCEAVFLRVTLLDAAGRSRGQRLAELAAGCDARVVHVAISLACARVTCPGDGDPANATTCQEGRCVAPSCLSGDCGEVCASDADCGAATRGCASMRCTEAGCLEVDACGAGEVCRAAGCEAAPRCGDGACDPSTETPCACAEDCTTSCPAGCGDGACGAGEAPGSCPEDCGPPDPVCGDSICELAEACPADCGGGPVCGDATCDPGEVCPADCPPVCGDAVCEGGETCEACVECCDAGCGDGACSDEERAGCACPGDCGPCTTCGDDRCDAGESCAADCTADRGICGDGACEIERRETCGTCQPDCGWCIGLPAIAQDAACHEPGGSGGDVCGDLPEAWTDDAVHVAYYPMMAARSTALVSGEGLPPLAMLSAGDLFAAESTRNPRCNDQPPLRPARDGWLFGYVVAGTGIETRVGWVRAEDLALDLLPEEHPCVTGATGGAYQIPINGYSRNPSCEALGCVGPPQSCAAAYPPGRGADDCGGAVTDREAFVDVDTLLLRYSQEGAPRRYLHRDDRVRVRYEVGMWAFVIAGSSAAPVLSPPGSRGWVLASFLR